MIFLGLVYVIWVTACTTPDKKIIMIPFSFLATFLLIPYVILEWLLIDSWAYPILIIRDGYSFQELIYPIFHPEEDNND